MVLENHSVAGLTNTSVDEEVDCTCSNTIPYNYIEPSIIYEEWLNLIIPYHCGTQ